VIVENLAVLIAAIFVVRSTLVIALGAFILALRFKVRITVGLVEDGQ